MVLLTAEFFCGVNNDIASSRGCRHGRHGFPSRLPRVATSTVLYSTEDGHNHTHEADRSQPCRRATHPRPNATWRRR